MEVVVKLADGVVLFGGQSVIEPSACTAGQTGQPTVGLEGAAFVGEEAVWHLALGVAAAREQLDDGGRRFRSEQHAFWRAHHFNAIQRARCEIGEIDVAAGIVHRHAVQQHQSGGTLRSASVHGRQAAVAPVSRHRQPGHFAQDVRHRRELALGQVGTRDDRCRDTGFFDRGFRARGRHNNTLAQPAHRQRDASFTGRADAGLDAFKTGGGNRGIARRDAGNAEAAVGAC